MGGTAPGFSAVQDAWGVRALRREEHGGDGGDQREQRGYVVGAVPHSGHFTPAATAAR
jgi:hypothetical protein